MKTVSRRYGGCLSTESVKHCIMRAFFNEELRKLKMKDGKSKNTNKYNKIIVINI